MERFVIEGGHALEGSVRPSGSKNEALPVLAACLLSSEPITLTNLPNIVDVRVMLEDLEDLGCEVVRGENTDQGWTVTITAADLRGPELEPNLCKRIRASILFAGPMVARLGEVKLPPPGGDVIGRRRVDTHFLGLESLGAKLLIDDGYRLISDGLTGAEIFLDEQSVTATENIVMAAALARGTTTIMNAACEPHVQGLCRMLVAMGAEISGIGTNTLSVTGAERLSGTEHRIGPIIWR